MVNNNDITFETKVYENDWEYILKGNYLDKIIDRCNYSFTKRILLINNVQNLELVKEYANKKVLQGVLDTYYVVDDYAEEALSYFKIKKESFNGGYYYSIAEFVSIYLCSTAYLLHFSSDSFLEKSNMSWIDEAIGIFKKRDDIIVANPTWNFLYNDVKKESISEIDDFYLGYGFSDQCCLIKVSVFKAEIYNEKHIESERYPKYGGELFEKRVDAFMRTNNKLRITSKKVSYLHLNFPKNRFTFFGKLYLFFFNYKRLSKA